MGSSPLSLTWISTSLEESITEEHLLERQHTRGHMEGHKTFAILCLHCNAFTAPWTSDQSISLGDIPFCKSQEKKSTEYGDSIVVGTRGKDNKVLATLCLHPLYSASTCSSLKATRSPLKRVKSRYPWTLTMKPAYLSQRGIMAPTKKVRDTDVHR